MEDDLVAAATEAITFADRSRANFQPTPMPTEWYADRAPHLTGTFAVANCSVVPENEALGECWPSEPSGTFLPIRDDRPGMQFCDDCGSMMKAEGDRMVCSTCGAAVDRDRDREAEFVTTEAQTGDEVIESDENADMEGKPKATDVRCDDCGNEEAWYYIQQTASADEPPTRFFKCTECGHRWRGYN